MKLELFAHFRRKNKGLKSRFSCWVKHFLTFTEKNQSTPINRSSLFLLKTFYNLSHRYALFPSAIFLAKDMSKVLFRFYIYDFLFILFLMLVSYMLLVFQKFSIFFSFVLKNTEKLFSFFLRIAF